MQEVNVFTEVDAGMGQDKIDKDRSLLRQKLQSKGYIVEGEFSCKGFNTNSFLKYSGTG